MQGLVRRPRRKVSCTNKCRTCRELWKQFCHPIPQLLRDDSVLHTSTELFRQRNYTIMDEIIRVQPASCIAHDGRCWIDPFASCAVDCCIPNIANASATRSRSYTTTFGAAVFPRREHGVSTLRRSIRGQPNGLSVRLGRRVSDRRSVQVTIKMGGVWYGTPGRVRGVGSSTRNRRYNHDFGRRGPSVRFHPIGGGPMRTRSMVHGNRIPYRIDRSLQDLDLDLV